MLCKHCFAKFTVSKIASSDLQVHKTQVCRAVTSIGQKIPDEKKMKSCVELVTSHKNDYTLDHFGKMHEVPVCFLYAVKIHKGPTRVTTIDAEILRF